MRFKDFFNMAFKAEVFGEVRRKVVFSLHVAARTKEAGQRAKHLTGPGVKPRTSADQTSVDTSMFSGVMLMLLTDDGRPPRIRLDTVPAVEITVPFLVCSM